MNYGVSVAAGGVGVVCENPGMRSRFTPITFKINMENMMTISPVIHDVIIS
jgi:hypothetical protein